MDPNTDSGTLAALADEYWETYLETHPLYATGVGDTRFDDRLPDPTPDGQASCAAAFRSILERSAALDAGVLDADDRVTLSALRESLAADIAELTTGVPAWNVNPLEGIPFDVLQLPAYQRLETPEDGGRMIARWRAIGPYTDRYESLLRDSLRDGRVACAAPTRRAIATLEAILARRAAEWPLAEPLAADALATWSTADRERFTDGILDAIDDRVRPAFARLHRTLAGTILPVARPDATPGMGALPGGEDAYAKLIRMHTSLEASAADLHQTGLREIARVDDALQDLACGTLGATGLESALATLRADPGLYFATRDELFATAAASLARAAEAAPAWFGRLPEARCEIVRMAEHEEANAGAAWYQVPAHDGSRPGQFILNTSQPHLRPRYELEALTYHEAIPGHHLQIALGQELEDLPLFRRNLGPTSYFEGWGLYAERLADEMGLYSGDVDRIGQLSFDAWRAARLVVDTGIHSMGWSREDAVGFMTRHTALSPSSIADEVDRYIVLPGQALAYKTGQLELLRLRDDARAAMGDAFDIRAFHDTVLAGGALPLQTLRSVVVEWATRRPAAQALASA